MSVNWIGNGTIVAYSSYHEPKQMSGYYDRRYYDQIITRLHIQGIE